MNQFKLEVVKEEMATVNVNVLGISELKWTGMGEFKLFWVMDPIACISPVSDFFGGDLCKGNSSCAFANPQRLEVFSYTVLIS